MNSKNSFFVAALFIASFPLFLMTGCGGGSGSSNSSLIISGRVTNGSALALQFRAAGDPLKGVTVSACGGSDVTDDNGNFSFETENEGCAGTDVLFTISGSNISGTTVVSISSTSDRVNITFVRDSNSSVIAGSIEESDDDSSSSSVDSSSDDDSSDDEASSGSSSDDDSLDDSSDDHGSSHDDSSDDDSSDDHGGSSSDDDSSSDDNSGHGNSGSN